MMPTKVRSQIQDMHNIVKLLALALTILVLHLVNLVTKWQNLAQG